jgi:hypothetical protein
VLVLEIVLLIEEQAPAEETWLTMSVSELFDSFLYVSFGSFLLFSTGLLQSFPNTVHSFVFCLFSDYTALVSYFFFFIGEIGIASSFSFVLFCLVTHEDTSRKWVITRFKSLLMNVKLVVSLVSYVRAQIVNLIDSVCFQ